MSGTIYYILKHKATGTVLDGKDDTLVYRQPPNGGDYQKWKLATFNEGDDEYFSLIQKATETVLDGKDDTLVYRQPPNGGDYQKWKLATFSRADGYWSLQQKATGKVLDGKDETLVYMQHPNGGDYQKWQFIPSSDDIEWKISLVNIEYTESKQPVPKPELIHSEIITNSAQSATVTRKISMSCKKSSTFEWSFQQTLGVEGSTSFEANVPFGSVAGGVSLNVELSKTETISKTQEITYEVSSEVQVPPNSSIKVSGYVDWAEDVKTEFTFKLRVSATNNKQPVSGSDLGKLMKLTNSTAKIEQILNNELIISITGSFAGAFGLDSLLKVEPYKAS